MVEDKNPENQYGLTPLHAAAFLGHVEIVKLILPFLGDKNPISSAK